MSARSDILHPPSEVTDAAFMAAAISYGRRGLGVTAPNPAVGCVIVKDGVIIAHGATQPGGRPHAETEAIRMAGEQARGATLYVSLEPCSHHGVTAPCASAIVNAGIVRVVSALEDPDPRVAGRGHGLLVNAGIALRAGIGAADARRANLGHITRITLGRPMVTLKLAETLDGYAAGGDHDPRLMITGVHANNRTHMMRALHDAIMVGVGTVLADDPMMNVRAPGLENRKPLRVVLDTHGRLPLTSRLALTARTYPTLVLCGPDVSEKRQAALEAHGIQVERVALGADGHIDLGAALKALGQRGITRVMSEGGPTIAQHLIAGGFADDVVMFTSPKPLMRAGVPALDAKARATLSDPKHYSVFEDTFAGQDRLRVFERMI